jgi:hypothetical protein
MGISIGEILCLQEQRTVRPDNCGTYKGRTMKFPAHHHRCHFVKAEERVLEYPDQSLAIFYGSRCLARYTKAGQPLDNGEALSRKLEPKHRTGGLRNQLRGPAAGGRQIAMRTFIFTD